MKKLVLLTLLIVSGWTLAHAETVYLRTGERVQGTVIFQNEEVVIIRTEEGQRFQYPRADVELVATDEEPRESMEQTDIVPQEQEIKVTKKDADTDETLKEETESGRRAAFLLGGQMEEPIAYGIAGRDWEHLLLPVRKDRPTPKAYPRKAGIPKQKPLGV